VRSLKAHATGIALLVCAGAAAAQDTTPEAEVDATPTAMPTGTPGPGLEASEVPATPAPTPEASAEVDQSAVVMAVVIDFHQAIEEGYREGAVRLLDENLIVFETGYVETSRDEYAGGHLDADMQYAMTVKREIVHSQTMVSGNVAVVLSQTRSRGEFAGKKINLTNTETMVLRLGPDGWKIAHIHWSGHELKDVPAAKPDAQ
jgi:ketosteroid isomerase-like protein